MFSSSVNLSSVINMWVLLRKIINFSHNFLCLIRACKPTTVSKTFLKHPKPAWFIKATCFWIVCKGPSRYIFMLCWICDTPERLNTCTCWATRPTHLANVCSSELWYLGLFHLNVFHILLYCVGSPLVSSLNQSISRNVSVWMRGCVAPSVGDLSRESWRLLVEERIGKIA